jgi:hypothetical protein
MPAQLADAVVVERADGGVLQHADHAFRLTVASRVIRLREAVLDTEQSARALDRVAAPDHATGTKSRAGDPARGSVAGSRGTFHPVLAQHASRSALPPSEQHEANTYGCPPTELGVWPFSTHATRAHGASASASTIRALEGPLGDGHGPGR